LMFYISNALEVLGIEIPYKLELNKLSTSKQ
jgi:hypothetical protein